MHRRALSPGSGRRISSAVQVFDETIRDAVIDRLLALEKHFEGDVIFYYGPIDPSLTRVFRDFLERLATAKGKRERLVFFVNTNGGSAEAAEKMVEIARFHYREVFFVVPDFAMSAGTILCMAGDKIFMDYSSSLGPIDPQVFNGKDWVPALGYLDKVEQLLAKARSGELTNAEFLILQNQDLATLSRYEQARDLTVSLLRKWLVEFKFRDWTHHRSDPDKKGAVVTVDQKKARAEQVAHALNDNKRWHSHSRMIGLQALRAEVGLEIDDYSNDVERQRLVRSYNDLLTEYVARHGQNFFMHSREHF